MREFRAVMQDPAGTTRSVFPRLFSYVVDDPESKDLLCIKGGNSAYSCELCWVPKDRLWDVTVMYDMRTEKDQVRPSL